MEGELLEFFLLKLVKNSVYIFNLQLFIILNLQ